MAKASVQHDFDLPLVTLWELVGDFADMSRWTGLPPQTCIAQGEGVGSTRILTPPSGGTIVDRLDALTASSYSYSIVNMTEAPLPFTSYKAKLRVDPLAEYRTRLTWSGEFEPDGITDEEAISFAQQMYQRGLEMMKQSASKLAQ